MRWARPPQPEGFDRSVANARRAIAAIAEREAPESKAFPASWKRFKHTFAEAHYTRCAYCDLTCTDYGAVEHYRPKAELCRVADPDAPNTEDPPPQVRVSQRGWWWLAYEWSNWCLACTRCNSQWKRNLFPVVGGHAGAPSPDEHRTPLLLHPYDGPEPERHLAFDATGAVYAQADSPYGAATIRTVGLHRLALMQARRDVAERAHALIARALDTSQAAGALAALARSGSPRALLASVVRCIWYEATGIPWRRAFRPSGDPGRDEVHPDTIAALT